MVEYVLPGCTKILASDTSPRQVPETFASHEKSIGSALLGILKYGLTIDGLMYSQRAYSFLPSMWDLLKNAPSRSGMVFAFPTLHSLKCFVANKGSLAAKDVPTVSVHSFATLLALGAQTNTGVLPRVTENPNLCWILFGAGDGMNLLTFYCFCCDKNQDATLLQTKCLCCEDSGCEMKRCAKCKTAFYCSVECQRQHWSLHKHGCKKKSMIHRATAMTVQINKPYLNSEELLAPQEFVPC